MDRWLIISTAASGATGLAGLLWYGTGAWLLVLPLAGLAAAPLLRLPGCSDCATPSDPCLAFCPGCARPL